MTRVTCRLLGPVEVHTVDRAVALGPKARAVVALLAVAGGPVPATEVVAAVWGDDAGPRAAHALQQQVSSIRKVIEADATAPTVLRTAGGTYLLAAESDLASFRAAWRAAEQARAAGLTADAAARYDDALSSWRGSALADVRSIGDHLERLAAGLDEERLACTDAWARTRCDLDPAGLVPTLERLVAEHPWRERLRATLMLALYRTGRHADALAAYTDGRRVLGEELGLEPGPELRHLEQQIIRHDPALLVSTDPAPVAPIDADPPPGLYATARAGDADAPALRLPDGQVVVLEGEVLIGRVPEAAVRLVDSRVSRRHATVSWTEAGWVVRDLGSTNGTRVNGGEAGAKPLADGDEVDVGGVVLTVVRGPGDDALQSRVSEA